MNKANTAEGTNQANHVSGLDCASAQSALSLSLSLSLSLGKRAAYRSTHSVFLQTAAFVLDG